MKCTWGMTLAALLLTSVACDAGSRKEPATASAVESATDATADRADAAKDDTEVPGSPRMVIRRVQLELRAESPDAVAAIATRLAEEVGGFVASSDTQGVGAQIHRVDTSLRIPSDRFSEVLAQLRAHGELLQETVSGEDVTEQHADLDARLRSQRALEERLLAILERVDSVEEALAVETQLSVVRTQVERIDARVKSMEDRVSLATIDLVVSAPVQANPRSAETVSSRIGRAVDDAGRLFIDAVAGLIRVIGALLPLGLMFGPVVFISRRLWRRRKEQLALMAAARASRGASPSATYPVHQPPMR